MKLLDFHRPGRRVGQVVRQLFGSPPFYAYGARAELGISIMTRMLLRNTSPLRARRP
jgi:hypothetical protein